MKYLIVLKIFWNNLTKKLTKVDKQESLEKIFHYAYLYFTIYKNILKQSIIYVKDTLQIKKHLKFKVNKGFCKYFVNSVSFS